MIILAGGVGLLTLAGAWWFAGGDDAPKSGPVWTVATVAIVVLGIVAVVAALQAPKIYRELPGVIRPIVDLAGIVVGPVIGLLSAIIGPLIRLVS